MARAKVVAKAKTSASARKRPVKAGSTMPKNIGGIVNVKTLAIAHLIKKKRK